MSDRLTTNIIPPCGPLDARLCFIGEAPGEEEDLSGKPFVGSAGQFQDNVFRQVGIVRSQVLLTNVFWQRPPLNDIGYFYEDKQQTKFTWEALEHIENLRVWLESLNPRPNLLIAVGRHAMFALTGKKRIWKWRGSVLPCTLVPGYKVYCTFHPSGVMRLINEPEEELQEDKKNQARNALPLYIRDLERVLIQGEFPEIRNPVRKFDVELTFDDCLNKLAMLERERLCCAVDIETLPLGPEGPILWCIGFAPSPDYAFVIPFLRNQKFCWTITEEAQLLRAISRYFLSPAKKVFQYGNYDLSVLGRYYGLRVADGTYEDTMWLHQAAWPQLYHKLEVLTSSYTWEPYYKDEGKVNMGRRSSDYAEFIYNAKDCCVTREIFDKLMLEVRQMGCLEGYYRSMSYMPSLFTMMIRGVRCDITLKEQLREDYARMMTFHQTALNELEGEIINMNSPKQLCSLLYYKHQFKEQRKRNKARTLTTDAVARQKLRQLYPNEKCIEHIDEFKKFKTLHGTYTEMKVDSDARIHTSYGFVSTWRLNSSESPFGSGGNLQNIPSRTPEGRAIRRCFISDEMVPYSEEQWPHVLNYVSKVTEGKVIPENGRKLMVARDLSQAEARFVVWDAEDLRVMEMFLDSSLDVHWERTKDIFGLDKNQPYVKDDYLYIPLIREKVQMKELRRLGKTTKHAGNYGTGPFKFSQILLKEGFSLPYSTCKAILDRTVESDPFLKAWQGGIRNELQSTRVLVTPPPFNRKRFFQGRFNNNLWRAGYAFKPQSTVGELLEHAIEATDDKFGDYIDILLNVHDEIVYQVEPHNLGRSLQDTSSVLEIPIEIRGRELIIPAEAKAGLNWADLVEFHPQLQ